MMTAETVGAVHGVGRVRFILTDTRSQRTATSMLGQRQLDWFIDEMEQSSATHALVVWANPTPWISNNPASVDSWAAYPDERRYIADAIADAGISNLLMVGGDAHMVAIDDGTNSDYATNGGGGFPLLHAGALDRPGSVKGGPYSHGAVPGGGQYGVLDITDDGGSLMTVIMRGERWDGNELVTFTLDLDVPPRMED